jgi:hypothetical protein
MILEEESCLFLSHKLATNRPAPAPVDVCVVGCWLLAGFVKFIVDWH